jgi:hypothetical protein
MICGNWNNKHTGAVVTTNIQRRGFVGQEARASGMRRTHHRLYKL